MAEYLSSLPDAEAAEYLSSLGSPDPEEARAKRWWGGNKHRDNK